jgi:small-conductance mechanosensitive channel
VPTVHPSAHLIASAAFLLASVGLMAAVRNRVIRRRLLFSAVASAAAALVHALAIARPEGTFWAAQGWRIEQLVLVVAAANAAIALAFNPWFRDGDSDRAPAIVQDSLAIAAAIGAGVVLFDVSSFSFLTGSAIVAAIVGFALQDTLGNAFAGIAIQIERPFRVGHWISVGEHVGLVTEVTWRATKIRTKAGNMVAVPNSQMGSHAINNYSEPAAPTRIHVEVGAAYGAPPNDVREALLAAARGAAYVLPSPAPDVVLADFGASALIYHVRFWVDDFSRDELAKDAVRTRLYYEFRRRKIEIPWPIQVEYQRQEAAVDTPERRDRFVHAVSAVPVLARLPADALRALASTARELLFADGETIVREGEPGTSMFLVLAGRVAITVGPDRRQVAVTDAGGYFGEMSLLTGEPRTATVSARGDCTTLEITAEAFRSYVQQRPEIIDDLAAAASARKRELDEARAAAGAAPATAQASLRERMRKYFGLG